MLIGTPNVRLKKTERVGDNFPGTGYFLSTQKTLDSFYYTKDKGEREKEREGGIDGDEIVRGWMNSEWNENMKREKIIGLDVYTEVSTVNSAQFQDRGEQKGSFNERYISSNIFFEFINFSYLTITIRETIKLCLDSRRNVISWMDEISTGTNSDST